MRVIDRLPGSPSSQRRALLAQPRNRGKLLSARDRRAYAHRVRDSESRQGAALLPRGSRKTFCVDRREKRYSQTRRYDRAHRVPYAFQLFCQEP